MYAIDAKGFDNIVNHYDPRWDIANKNQGTVTSIWPCNSATAENGHPSLAEMVSKAHPNILVIGVEGFKIPSPTGNKINRIETVMGSGKNDGSIVIFQNGIELHRKGL